MPRTEKPYATTNHSPGKIKDMFTNSKNNLTKKFKRQVQLSAELSKKTKPTQRVRRALVASRNALLGNPEQSYGQSFVTEKLEKDTHSTYWVAVVANGINVMTSVPAFFFGFASLGGFGLLLTTALSAGVFKISNESAAAASGSTKGNRLWSNQGLMMFIGLNVLLSIISGIGSELMINRSELRFALASELIAEQEDEVWKIQNDPDVTTSVEECKVLEEMIASLPENSPERRSPYTQAYGQYGTFKDYSDTPDSQKPKCILADEKQQEAEERAAPISDRLEQGSAIENKIDFLKQEFPDIYAINFNSDGSVTSGSKEFRLAFQSFYGRLLSGNFSDMGRMGFSLFILLLSLLTSAGACLMMIAHVCREDTKLSHSPVVREAIEKHLVYLEKEMFKEADALSLEDEAFLSPLPLEIDKTINKTESTEDGAQSSMISSQSEPSDETDTRYLHTPEAQRAVSSHIAYIKRFINYNNTIPFPISAHVSAGSQPPTKLSLNSIPKKSPAESTKTPVQKRSAQKKVVSDHSHPLTSLRPIPAQTTLSRSTSLQPTSSRPASLRSASPKFNTSVSQSASSKGRHRPSKYRPSL